ncbi:putative RING-H2 finger protein ATL21A [Hibiscus syriacus]|uniref:putative RING-H2 finger protein ATL21A n=1 Tax=Hibiscus syriacus TaxID=106335 RepID=UPI001920E287|nr:putative RING-H2 finger protein ATL21A [Hibiscus syriacus]
MSDICQPRCGYQEISFPFQLRNENRCGYPGFDLSCNNQNDTIISFPSSGNFSVETINYYVQFIAIGDPDGCLPKRLLEGFDTAATPFHQDYLQNFTLLNCSYNVPYMDIYVTYIPCLSSDGNCTVAIPVDRPDLFEPFSSCREIATVSLPLLEKWEYLSDRIWLRWNEPDCKWCLEREGVCRYKKNTGFDVGCSSFLDPGYGENLFLTISTSEKNN